MRSEPTPSSKTLPTKMRIDKWLWCARFYKTRSLATQAVDGGKVRLNQERVKPAHDITPGDQLSIQIGEFTWQIEVLGLSLQRSAAPIAQADVDIAAWGTDGPLAVLVGTVSHCHGALGVLDIT